MFPAPTDFYLVSLRQQEIRSELGRNVPGAGRLPSSGAVASGWATARRASHAAVRSLARVERRAVGVAMLAMVLVVEWRLTRMARA